MTNNTNLVDDLIGAAYNTGYYSGKREDGQPHHLEAIEERSRLRDEVLRRLAAAPDLAEALKAADAALRHHPGGDNRSEEDIERARAALERAGAVAGKEQSR